MLTILASTVMEQKGAPFQQLGPRYSVRMADVRIREARDDDVPGILKLYQEGGIGPDESFSEEEARVQLKLFKIYPSYRVFVVESEGKVVGTYELLIMDNLAKRGRKSAVVEDVAIGKQHQGRGLGKAMMVHPMQLARDAGCYKLTLSSNLRRSDAHAFCEALGFKKHGYSFLIELRA